MPTQQHASGVSLLSRRAASPPRIDTRSARVRDTACPPAAQPARRCEARGRARVRLGTPAPSRQRSVIFESRNSTSRRPTRQSVCCTACTRHERVRGAVGPAEKGTNKGGGVPPPRSRRPPIAMHPPTRPRCAVSASFLLRTCTPPAPAGRRCCSSTRCRSAAPDILRRGGRLTRAERKKGRARCARTTRASNKNVFSATADFAFAARGAGCREPHQPCRLQATGETSGCVLPALSP